ncbi:hypothetical protein LTR95_005021 [Oleoguttula sp. CCFEE 5521]
MSELFSAFGYPARLIGRLPLLPRYLWAGSSLSANNDYVLQRYGATYKLRPWLLLDTHELEVIERLLNQGSDIDIVAFRTAHLLTASNLTVVGGLLASASSAILTLPSLDNIHYAARGLFILSLMLSLLSVYFTILQQRVLNNQDAHALRLWLWDGTIYTLPIDPERVLRRSSLSSNILLQSPFELLSISIALFLGALGFYLGLAYASKVRLSKGSDSNIAVLIAFVAATFFALAVFGQSLGQKDREMAKCRQIERDGLQGSRDPSANFEHPATEFAYPRKDRERA